MATILVVDDVETNRYVLEKILKADGFRVITAADGAGALAGALQKPDLILLDINMPDIDGFSVCDRLKKDPRTEVIPILMTSATYYDLESRVRGLETGAIDYLAQPINKAELLARVHSNLRSKYYYDRAQRETRRFQLLAEIGNLFFTSLTNGRFSPGIPEKIMAMFDGVGAGVFYRDRAEGAFRWLLTGGLFTGIEAVPNAGTEPPSGLLARALSKRRMIVASRAEVDRDPFLEAALRGLTFDGLALSPLVYQEYSKGILLIALPKNDLSPEEEQPLEVLSSRLTSALLNQEAYLYLQRMNETLSRSNLKLREEAMRSKTALSYASHDLKTPLNAILGFTSLLLDRAMDSKKAEEALKRILANAKELLRILDRGLNEFRYTMSGAVEVDVSALVLEQIQNELAPLLFGKEIDIKSRVEPDVRLPVSEPDMIKHILSNLFSNAAKFTVLGSIEIGVRKVKERNREGVQITVFDTGIGIAPERLNQIFDPFNHTSGYDGSGLGLTIIHGIVQAMGGKIKVKSKPGVGSRFTVWLPAEPPLPSPEPAR
ncbi:MAG: hybrid sensor histidine kinase/response regulator [Nitrospirae bacterium]|nr:hybrid sensor histidine kinase/response regulator [Candidatus Manganitrophaceae bacterium]